MALITFLSFHDFSDYDQQIHLSLPFADKAGHAVFYGVGSILACMSIRERTRGEFALSSSLIATAIFMAVYGTIIEVFQMVFTAVRSGEIGDFLANIIGVSIALFMVRKLFSSNSRLKWKY